MTNGALIDGLARALLESASSFEAGREWPAALLWPDPERQWFSAFPELRRRLAAKGVALFAHGDYAPMEGVGPAIWLRCLIEAPRDGAFPNGPLQGLPVEGALPVILLPGLSWRALREPLTLDRGVQTLVEMQYRGDVFRQRRQARDWTVATFLRDPDQGLGLDVATDSRTDEAARRALAGLLDLPLENWRGRAVSTEDFNRLLVQDDLREILAWMSDPDAARFSKDAGAWAALRDLVKRDYAVDIDEKGSLQSAVERLIRQKGPWKRIWSRLAESPQQFRPVYERIRAAAEKGDLLAGLEEADPAANPHDNTVAEKMLAQDLADLANLSPKEATAKIILLETRHRARRGTLWARLDEAPLARLLEPLARLAACIDAPLQGDDLTALSSAYAEEGWRVDCALIETIAAAGAREDLAAHAAGVLYRPWVDALARRFRAAYEAAGEAARPRPLVIEPGTLVLFVDGLRMDVGRILLDRLRDAGAAAEMAWRLSPVPTVTATAKPLVTPVADLIAGAGKVSEFLPLETSSGKPATTDALRRAMLARGIQVIDSDAVSAPETSNAIGYTECGHLDHDGHSLQLRLAGQIEVEVRRISERILSLMAAGWTRIRVVTDHGWLLMPGGFVSMKLPGSVTETAWSRAAILTAGAPAGLASIPWHWDKSVRIAMPPGAEAFRGGDVYSHGGLSPQECVIPDITIGGAAAVSGARISGLNWRRLRLTVNMTGELAGITVEVRRKERDPASRVDVSSKIDGLQARLTVSDEVDEGDPVLVVLIDRHGGVADVRATQVGDRG